VIACKHQSAWETLTLGAILPPFVWVLKDSLIKRPFFGDALRLVGAIGIDRNKRQAAFRTLISEGRERLDQRACIVVFPEGTRFSPGTAGSYHPGAAVMAAEGGVKLLPVAHNAGEFWGAYAYAVRSGVVDVRIGPALDVADGTDHRSMTAAVRQWIEDAMRDITAPAFRDGQDHEEPPGTKRTS
jgi:1-acyl-sn-glycerol-3-phosphate acyltransferase